MKRERPDDEFWELVHPHTGAVVDTQPTTRGFGSDLTAVVKCERGPFFVKAMRNRPGGRRDSLIRERLINSAVRPISPALRWHAENDGWIALGFDVVDGRRSDFRPNSPDVAMIVDLLDRIGRLALPKIAREWPETRWNRFTTDDTEAELFRARRCSTPTSTRATC